MKNLRMHSHPLQKSSVGIIRGYQAVISPLLGAGVCRFYPSCSEYMIQSIEKYGVFSGAMHGLKRIGKCHPFNAGGYDPL